MRNGGSGGSGDGAVSVGAVCCCRLVGRPGWSLLSAAKPVLFEHSPYLISVGQAYGIVVLSRCLGAAWFAILIALLSILFRQTVLTTFSGIAVSILPHLIGGSFLKYVLPLPAGLLAGTGYVWGTLTEVGYDEDWNLIDIVTFPGHHTGAVRLFDSPVLGYRMSAGVAFVSDFMSAGGRPFLPARS